MSEEVKEELKEKLESAAEDAAKGNPEGVPNEDTPGEVSKETPEANTDEPTEVDDSVPSWLDDPDYREYFGGSSNEDDESGEFKKIPVEEYNALVEAANNWKSFEGNEVAMAVISHINSGGKVEDLISHFDTRDYSKMSPEELFEIDLRSTPDITDEEISEALEEFRAEPSYRQKKTAIELREKLSSRKNKNGQGLVAAYQNNIKKHESMVAKFTEDFDGEINRWKGKSYFDVPVTDDVVQEIRQFVKSTNGMILADKSGNIDAKKYFQAVFALLYQTEIAGAKLSKGAKKAAAKYIAEHQNAGVENKPGGEVPSNVNTDGVDWNAKFRKTFGAKKK